MERISIDPITRLEGHGKIEIFLDDQGEVANTSSGVAIHIEGVLENIEAFRKGLLDKAPPLAHITEISIDTDDVKGYTDFTIAKSKGNASKSTLISPAVSIWKPPCAWEAASARPWTRHPCLTKTSSTPLPIRFPPRVASAFFTAILRPQARW